MGKPAPTGKPAKAEKKKKTDTAASPWASVATYAYHFLPLVVAAAVCWKMFGAATQSSNVKSEAAKVKKPVVEPSYKVWVPAGKVLDEAMTENMTCVKPSGGFPKGACGAPFRSGRCARLVIDNAFPTEQIKALQQMVQWLIDEAWGGGAGPPSVVDLHAGSISYKEKFVELKKLMDFKQVNFTDEHIGNYLAIRKGIQKYASAHFGIPHAELQHDMAFFSHINASKEAKKHS
jgi:hypothetical protein